MFRPLCMATFRFSVQYSVRRFLFLVWSGGTVRIYVLINIITYKGCEDSKHILYYLTHTTRMNHVKIPVQKWVSHCVGSLRELIGLVQIRNTIIYSGCQFLSFLSVAILRFTELVGRSASLLQLCCLVRKSAIRSLIQAKSVSVTQEW